MNDHPCLKMVAALRAAEALQNVDTRTSNPEDIAAIIDSAAGISELVAVVEECRDLLAAQMLKVDDAVAFRDKTVWAIKRARIAFMTAHGIGPRCQPDEPSRATLTA